MYTKVASQSPGMKSWRRNPHHKRSAEEEFFRKMFGDYPANENEIKQFLPYYKERKADNYLNKNYLTNGYAR